MKEITTNLLENLSALQGRGQNQKQVPQNFMKLFDVDDVSLTSQLMTSNRKNNVASEIIINYRVTSLSIVIRNGKIVWKPGPNRPFFLYNLSSENS